MPATVTDRLFGLTTSVAVKAPCKAVATANITLSGLQTLNGVTVAEGDRVLVKTQTTASENGVYLASTSNWVRAPDFDGARDVVQGTQVPVALNGAQTALYEVTSANPITIGTSAINFQLRYSANTNYDITDAEESAEVTPVNYAYPPFDVRRYGAVGDGSHDDTDAINNAILAAANSDSNVAAVRLIPGGTHKTTGTINWISGVDILGSPTKWTTIKPTMSSGWALDANITLINQRIRGVTIDGTNLSGTARALRIVQGNRTRFEQCSIINCADISDYAMQIKGAGYGLKFEQCVFSGNFKHWEIIRTATTGDFPTDILFDYCIFEDAQSDSGAAMAIVDASYIKLRDCTVQGNKCPTTLSVTTTTSQETNDMPVIEGGWWEDNGDGASGSVGIFLAGTSSRRLAEAQIRGVTFHQSAADTTTYQLWAEYTDGLIVRDCVESFGGTFLHDGGNNIKFHVDHRRIQSSVELKTPILWASAQFSGKTSVTINNNYNFASITRNSAGNYTLTFRDAPPSGNYIVNANSEDGAVDTYQIASPGPTSSTTSFDLMIANAAGSAVDGRNVSVTVWALPE